MIRTNNRVKTASELTALAGLSCGASVVLSFDGVDWEALRGNTSYPFETLCCQGRRGYTSVELYKLRIKIEELAHGRSRVTAYTSDGRLCVSYQYMALADRKFIGACVQMWCAERGQA